MQYSAVAIGAGSEDVNSFLEKYYDSEMTMDDAASLAISAINLKSDQKEQTSHIKMARITTENKMFEKISESNIQEYSQNASKFTPA